MTNLESIARKIIGAFFAQQSLASAAEMNRAEQRGRVFSNLAINNMVDAAAILLWMKKK